jgi:hypothetical protein
MVAVQDSVEILKYVAVAAVVGIDRTVRQVIALPGMVQIIVVVVSLHNNIVDFGVGDFDISEHIVILQPPGAEFGLESLDPLVGLVRQSNFGVILLCERHRRHKVCGHRTL